jgi:hypothetical protein
MHSIAEKMNGEERFNEKERKTIGKMIVTENDYGDSTSLTVITSKTAV